MTKTETLEQVELVAALPQDRTEERARAQSPTRMALGRLTRDKGAMVAVAVLAIFILCGVFAEQLAPYGPLELIPGASLQPPSLEHPMGTDLLGRDIFSRVLHGARISMSVGFAAIVVSVVVGVVVGMVSGYVGKRVDSVVMRIIDMMLAFPGILLALAIVSFLGSSLFNVTLAVGISFIPTFARLVRGSVLSVKENLYVEVARSLGSRPRRILFVHILPNVMSPVIVLASLAYGWAILNASSLSFLGLGVQPPTPEWGIMVSDGRGFLREAPWIATFPGLAIMLVVLAANILGDALRDAFDPHHRR